MLAALWIAACGDDGSDDGPPDLAPPPALDDIQRVVIVGDNAATNPSHARSAVALLARNDDAMFPAFAGLDLSTRLPGAELIRLSRGGDSYHALAALAEPICTCGAPCADRGACVDIATDTPTLVIVSLGLNDIFDAMIQLILDFTLVDDPQPLIDQLRVEVASVLAYFNDAERFPTRPLIAVVTPYDPADGVGDLAALATLFYPTFDPGDVTPELINTVLDAFAQILRDETENAGAVLIDAHAHFLGHGYHFDDPSLPQHDAQDPTIWIQNLLDPTPRGAHELRRVMWNQLTGQPVDDLPGPVPPGDGPDLPAVPDHGWANEVVEAALTLEFIDDAGINWINVADDPTIALGPPGTGTSAAVAIGLVDAYLILDLGEGEEAFDGPGADLVVMELGAMSGGAPEPYRVLVSDAPAGPFIPLADGRGERAFDLAGAGVTRARYVRIESHAHAINVTSGFGSPLYPGPEINAVGAVYPGMAP